MGRISACRNIHRGWAARPARAWRCFSASGTIPPPTGGGGGGARFGRARAPSVGVRRVSNRRSTRRRRIFRRGEAPRSFAHIANRASYTAHHIDATIPTARASIVSRRPICPRERVARGRHAPRMDVARSAKIGRSQKGRSDSRGVRAASPDRLLTSMARGGRSFLRLIPSKCIMRPAWPRSSPHGRAAARLTGSPGERPGRRYSTNRRAGGLMPRPARHRGQGAF